MPIFVYVIQSITSSKYYVGITKNLVDRLKRHNSNRNLSTKHRGPWKLIFSEKYVDYRSARLREIFLKSGIGRETIKRIIEKSLDMHF